MKFFHYLTEIIGWLQIVASPLLIGSLIGTIVYYNYHNIAGLIAGISIAALGLIIGIAIGTYAWKKYGTVRLLSRILGTPELDKEEE